MLENAYDLSGILYYFEMINLLKVENEMAMRTDR